MKEKTDTSLATLLQNFFCQRLMLQRGASPQTIASYRDTFCLLFCYAKEIKKKEPASLVLSDINADFILEFLNYLEAKRENCQRTRNLRLAAIRSFMNYVSYLVPGSLSVISQVLAIPLKKFNRPFLEFLTRDEVEAIIETQNKLTFSAHRDFVMFMTMYNTGARVSEIISLKVSDINLEGKAYIVINGKGRKKRAVPLWNSTKHHLKNWLLQIKTYPDAPVFPSRCGKPLSRSGVEYRLGLAIKKASEKFPSLKKRKISPHTLRHTTALHLLQSGVDITVIALWLGHESPATTHLYVEADMTMKENALKKLQDPSLKSVRYKPSDPILAFLESL